MKRRSGAENKNKELESAIRNVVGVYFRKEFGVDMLKDFETGRAEEVRDSLLEILKCRHEADPLALSLTELHRIYRALGVAPPSTTQM